MCVVCVSMLRTGVQDVIAKHVFALMPCREICGLSIILESRPNALHVIVNVLG